MSGGVKEVSAEYQINRHSREGGNPVEVDDCPVGYKRTEVGVIPEDWEITFVGDISNVKTGPFGSTLHEKDYVIDGTPIITVEHLGELGVTYKNLPMVSEFDRKRLHAYALKIGDIAFSRVGSIDRNALIRENEDGWLFSGRLLRVRLSNGKNIPEYLSYHFHSEPFKKRVVEVAVGQTMPSLNTSILKGIKIVLPPTKKEQTAIANALTDVDALITSLEKLIAKKRAIKTATMQQLLTGKKRLPPFDKTHTGYKQTELGEIPGDWEVGTIGDSAELITKGTTPMTIGRSFVQSGITFVKVESVSESGMFDRSKFAYIDNITDQLMARSKINDGDLLISIAGALGRAIIVTKEILPANTNQALAIVRFKKGAKLSALFVYHYTKSTFFTKHIEATSSQGAQPNLSLGDISNFPIVVVAEEEQRAIANILSDMDKEIATLEQRLNKTQQLKQGMMQELLTGKTRLIKTEQEAA